MAEESILSGITKETAPVAVDNSNQHQDSWHWDDGMPGSGPKPSWLKEKYNSVTAQAKAYIEAEKQLGQVGAAPENYDLADFVDQLDTANPHIQKFMETSKRSRISQDTFKEIVGTLVEYEKSKMPNIDEEIKKLGDGAQAKIDTVKRWAANNLSQEACDTLGRIGNRAEVIKFVDELRQMSLHAQSIPPGSAEVADNFVRLTQEDIDAELAVPANAQRYLNDKNYRAEIQRKLKMIFGEE